jgi:hypothetical protein
MYKISFSITDHRVWQFGWQANLPAFGFEHRLIVHH